MKNPFVITDMISLIAHNAEKIAASMGIANMTYNLNKPLVITIADSENAGGDFMTFDGILEYAEHHQCKNVLLTSFLPEEFLLENSKVFPIFMGLPNTFFKQLPLDNLILEKDISGIKNDISRSIANMMQVINHTTEKYLYDTEEEIEAVISSQSANIARAKKYFPELTNLDGRELLLEIKKIVNGIKIEMVMKDEDVDGVFCDIEGTLLINGEVNEPVLQMIRTFEQSGFEVTLWTLGDIKEIGLKLESFGISNPLKSKLEFAGANAEIVIDDEPEEIFRTRTGIVPKKFIRIK